MLRKAGSFEPVVQYPGDNCCYLFSDYVYEGTRIKFCHDDKEETFALDLYGFDNKLSSWYCGKRVWYNFCNTKWGEQCWGGAGHFKNRLVDRYNDQVSVL